MTPTPSSITSPTSIQSANPHLHDEAPLMVLLSKDVSKMNDAELQQHITELRRIHASPPALASSISKKSRSSVPATTIKAKLDDLFSDL